MNNPLFSISVLSDLHFMAYLDTGAPVDWVAFLEQEIKYIASLQPHFMVINGDLTNGKERDYRLAMPVLSGCGVPVHYTMGNHEYYGFYEDQDFTPELAQQRYLQFTGCPGIYYEQKVQDFTFLYLSTENYTPDSNETGWLSDAQLRWFEERLSAAEGRPAFVFLHHPVNGTVANSDNTCRQSDQLCEILRKFPNVLLFSGHTHCRMDRDDQFVRRDGTVFIGGGCMYEEYPQSRWVDVYPDRAEIRLLCHRERQWLDSYHQTVVFEQYE